MRRLIGKLVRIHNDSVISDIFGVYLGSRINLSWDSEGIYPIHRPMDWPIHRILTPTGIREVCIREEKLMKTLKVLS